MIYTPIYVNHYSQTDSNFPMWIDITGLWDNYLFWAQESYDNLMQGSNLTNRFLQMAVPQQHTNHQDTKTDENK